jgi:hypothetical protein
MQVFMTLLNIACNMQNMQNNMHDMQNMQTSFPICRICTAHFADVMSVIGAVTMTAGGPARLGPAYESSRCRDRIMIVILGHNKFAIANLILVRNEFWNLDEVRYH